MLAFHTRRTRFVRAGISVALMLICCAGSLLLSASSAIAQTAVTWNAQGAKTQSTESIWNNGVRALTITSQGQAGPPAVVAIQEAGPQPPASAQPTGREAVSGGSDGVLAREYIWNLGTASRPVTRYIYFMTSPGTGGRTNQATVTLQMADTFGWHLPGGGRRPALGLEFDNTSAIWWNVHILSGGGSATINEANQYIGELVQATVNAGRSNLVILGDWNTPPANINTSAGGGVDVVSPPCDQPTQQSGNVLDYAVRNPGDVSIAFNRRLGLLGSDHYPVLFTWSYANSNPVPAPTPPGSNDTAGVCANG